MAYSFVNFVQNSTDGTTSNTATSPSISVTAGNTLIVAFQQENNTSNLGVTITDGTNTYTDQFGAELTTGTEHLRVFTTTVASTNASLVLTATIGSAATSGFRAFLVCQYSGLATPATKDGGQLLLITNPGTGTDGMSISGTNATQPALVWGFSTNDSTSNPPTAGSGQTSRGTCWDFTGTNGAATLARFEDKRITGTGSQAATFTAIDGTSTYRSAMLMLDESGGGGGSTATCAWWKA